MQIHRSVKIFVISGLLVGSVSCTLHKRNKPLEGADAQKKANEAKPTAGSGIETQTLPNPTSGPQNVPDSTTIPQLPPIPINPQNNEVDSQTKLDLEEFKTPSACDETPKPEVTATAPQTTNVNPGSNVPAKEETKGFPQSSKKRFTGFSNENGLPYTDLSEDTLISDLRLHQFDSITDDSIKKDSIAFARSIQDIAVLDSTSNKLTIRLKFAIPKTDVNVLKFSGKISSETEFSPLALIFPVPEKNEAPPKNAIRSEVKCLDVKPSDGCKNFHLKLFVTQVDPSNSSENELRVDAIVRNSASSFEAKEVVSTNATLNSPIFNELFSNTAMKNKTSRIIDSIDLDSFAVVNGRSGYRILILTNKREHLYFSGPLLTSIGSRNQMTVYSNTKPDITDPVNATWAPISDGILSGMMTTSFLVGNDGRGKVDILMNVAEPGAKSSTPFLLSFKKL